MEGAISLVAVHLDSLSSVLSSSGKNSEVALATVALVATLSSFHQMWRVIHPKCFEQMMIATARCIQLTTKMLHLKEVKCYISIFCYISVFHIFFRLFFYEANFNCLLCFESFAV